MKKILLTVLLVVFFLTPVILFAQTDERDKPKEPPTKLEAFLSKNGQLIIKDFYYIGGITKVGTITLDALVLYEPGLEAQKIKGIQVQISEPAKQKTSFLDMDEIESTSKAISYMAGLAEKWKDAEREPYTDVTFSTKGGFTIAFYQKAYHQKGQKRGVYLSTGYISRAVASMDVEDFAKLKNVLDKGLSLLNQK